MKIQWVPAFDLLMVENESGRVLLDGDDLAQLWHRGYPGPGPW
jgi:hypothetical protein